MLTSIRAGKLLKYGVLLIVVLAAATGWWLVNEHQQETESINVQLKIAELEAMQEQLEQQLLYLDSVQGKCISPEIYTSRPTKCRTADGTFVQRGEMPSGIMILPENK